MSDFLRSIGITMEAGVVDVPTIFPGSLIARGALVIDESKLVAPGDALHEAAHIALAPPERRTADFAFLDGADGGEELTTIAWCWAALLKIGIEPEDIFHGTAYPRGDSAMIIESARKGVFIGFPLLQAWGMAFDEPNALARGVPPFPHMVAWLRPLTTIQTSKLRKHPEPGVPDGGRMKNATYGMTEEWLARMEAWLACARRGDAERLWEISDENLARYVGVSFSHLPREERYVWSGAPLAGKRVLLCSYHGRGDAIHFIRYAPLVKAVASRVMVWVQPELIPLLGSVEGIDELLPLHDGSPEVEFDVDVELMELPHVFRSTWETMPRDIPYIHVAAAPEPPRESFRVGVIWRGCKEVRSVPFELFVRLADVPDVTFVTLQLELEREEHDAPFHLVPDRLTPLGTASYMRTLDLVITVDTMTAHLAGALGVPVWVLLPQFADWRWMEDREDSPWYPTMRLFRQTRQGEWAPVIERVSHELAVCRRRGSPRRRMSENSPVRPSAPAGLD